MLTKYRWHFYCDLCDELNEFRTVMPNDAPFEVIEHARSHESDLITVWAKDGYYQRCRSGADKLERSGADKTYPLAYPLRSAFYPRASLLIIIRDEPVMDLQLHKFLHVRVFTCKNFHM